ncbi:thioredoxin-disulfide reductase [Patescibacteria group bacterium]|nr:thioredoxin-disulfide reductase [Patescibacteria group bacterium]
MQKDFDVIVLGSGPAGLTAALYTSRAFLKTLVIAGNSPGGQLTITTEVENFPGFPESIQGPDLIANMNRQVEKYGAKFINELAELVSGSFEEGFKVKVGINEFIGKTLIIATGASAKWLGLESEQRLKGKGVSACATCDGFFFKDKVVAVVGGGDASMEESSFLTRFVSKVYLIARADKDNLRASKIMQKEVLDNSKIELIPNTEVKEVLGDNSVEGIKVINNKTGEESIMEDVKGLFVAVGHKPDTDFLKGFIDLDEKGYVVRRKGSQTSIEGVFAGGDVHDHKYRQAVTAAGYGCEAALDAIKLLQKRGIEVKAGGY